MSSGRLDAVQDLMEEILKIQRENSKDTEVLEKVNEIIQKSNKLVEKSDSATEMIIDAKILHTGSQVVNSNVASFDTSFTAFNEDEYKKNLITYVKEHRDALKCDSSWKCFAPIVFHLFQKSVPVTYMLGSLSLDPPPPQQEKVRVERKKRTVEKETKLKPLRENNKQGESEEESNIYEHIFKSLVKCFKKTDKKPVLFLDFIIDPSSYWQSVENIFYFSFLIRDGTVKMFLNNDGLPVVEPVMKSEVDSGSKMCHSHFFLVLSKSDWRKCIKKFNLSTAKIPPMQK